MLFLLSFCWHSVRRWRRPKDLKKYGDPYSFPTAGKDLIWRLVPTKDGDRLYIRTTSRIYSSPTKWKVTELVFEPQD